MVGLRLREPTTRVGIPDGMGLCRDPSGESHDRDISNRVVVRRVGGEEGQGWGWGSRPGWGWLSIVS